MPTFATTLRWALRKLEGSNLVADIDAGFAALADDIDPKLTPHTSGTLAGRPVSTVGTPGITGRTYLATDTDELFLDVGAAWAKIPQGAVDLTALGLSDPVTARRGKSIIAAEETRTNTSFITMITPDTVTVTLPTDGLIFVAYSAQFKGSVADAGSAAIFIGTNQLKVPLVAQPNAIVQAAPTSSANVYQSLTSSPVGLLASQGNTGVLAPVATGQAVAISSESAGPGGNVRQDFGGSVQTYASPAGGPTVIFAAAGTYAVSVQYKVTSGTVTARNRKLWVWTMGF